MNSKIKKYLKNKVIMITGGTGSIGNAIIDCLLENKIQFKKIIIYSRDELKQFNMEKKYSHNLKKIRFLIGDIRDLSRLKFAIEDADILIHAAALKQVEKAERDPIESIKTNIYGAQNVIEASLGSKVQNVIALSTDKASSPINLYGATKLCSDKLFISANNIKGKRNIKYSVVRYGNVLGSRGSVLNVFKSQLKEKYFTLTDVRMTRFMISLNESVKFILNSMINNFGGEIFVPKLNSFKISDLGKALKPNAKFKFIGMFPGEKLNEELISVDDSKYTFETKDFYIVQNPYILSNFKKELEKKYKSKILKYSFVYNSLNNKYLSVENLKKILNSN